MLFLLKSELTLSQRVVLQVVIHQADDSIGTLPRVRCLVYELIHLPRESVTADPTYRTLPWSLEIDRTWLERVVWVVDLLSKVEGVVDARGASARWNCSIDRRREGIVLCEVLSSYLLALLHSCTLVGALHCSAKEVFLSLTECLH